MAIRRNKSTPEACGQTYFALVVITSSIFAFAFGTYSVESSGPTVTLRGKSGEFGLLGFGMICWMVGAPGVLTSKIATLAVQSSGCSRHSQLAKKAVGICHRQQRFITK